MLTMRPQPRAYMPSSAAWVSRKGAVSMISISCRQRASGNSTIDATCCMPALLMRMSRRPLAESVSSTSRRALPASVRSTAAKRAPGMRAASACPRSTSMSASVTAAPARASAWAVARPMPLAAPVTSAALPERSAMLHLHVSRRGHMRLLMSGRVLGKEREEPGAELRRLLDVRRVAAVCDHHLFVAPANSSVLVQHVAHLRHHRLRGEDLRAGPAGDEAKLAERAEIQCRGVGDDLVVRPTDPEYVRSRRDGGERAQIALAGGQGVVDADAAGAHSGPVR